MSTLNLNTSNEGMNSDVEEEMRIKKEKVKWKHMKDEE